MESNRVTLELIIYVQKEISDSPAVIEVSESELSVAKDRPAR